MERTFIVLLTTDIEYYSTGFYVMWEKKKKTEHKKKEFHMLIINYVTFSTITFIYFTKLNFRKRYQFLECFKNPPKYYLSCYIFPKYKLYKCKCSAKRHHARHMLTTV